MKLSIEQQKFSHDLSLLIGGIERFGYRVTFGEAYRPREMVAIYVKRGIGSRNSLHPKRLAADLNLFKDGRYLRKTKDYEIAGMFWESLDPLNRWGGSFSKRKDGNHFERTLKPWR